MNSSPELRVRGRWLILGVLCFTAACNDPPGDPDAGRDAGPDGGPKVGGFTITELDTDTHGRDWLAAAFDPATQRVGLAYFVQLDAFATDSGIPRAADGGLTANIELRYLEWKAGVVTGPQRVAIVQRTVGLSVAFNPVTSEPAVAYLGGSNVTATGPSSFWYQSDAVVSFRAAGVWTQQVAATMSAEANCNNNVISGNGYLVGLWPALAFEASGKAISVWRDGHDGQNQQADWGGSDLKVSVGGPGAWVNACAVPSNDSKTALGARSAIVIADGQPAVVYDHSPGGAANPGGTVTFVRRNADLSWTAPQVALVNSNTLTGASLAFDAVEGFGIAAVEHNGTGDLLSYTHLVGGQFKAAEPLFGTGSGGWYPSVAIDPTFHEPAVAFYLCGARPGLAEGTCNPAEDELRVTQRGGTNWNETRVDAEGGYLPRLAFFPGGKRVLAYRHPKTGAVKLAVER